MPSLDLGKMNKILQGRRGEEDLITTLRRVRGEYGHIPPETIVLIAKALKLAQSRVYSVATFYDEFRTQPQSVVKPEREKRIDEQILTDDSRLVLRSIGSINPENIDSYIAVGG